MADPHLSAAAALAVADEPHQAWARAWCEGLKLVDSDPKDEQATSTTADTYQACPKGPAEVEAVGTSHADAEAVKLIDIEVIDIEECLEATVISPTSEQPSGNKCLTAEHITTTCAAVHSAESPSPQTPHYNAEVGPQELSCTIEPSAVSPGTMPDMYEQNVPSAILEKEDPKDLSCTVESSTVLPGTDAESCEQGLPSSAPDKEEPKVSSSAMDSTSPLLETSRDSSEQTSPTYTSAEEETKEVPKVTIESVAALGSKDLDSNGQCAPPSQTIKQEAKKVSPEAAARPVEKLVVPESYWQVVFSVHPGGIIVRAGEAVTTRMVGRLQTGSIVKELVRKDHRMLYEGVAGHFQGPQTGWVSLKSVSRDFCTYLGSDYNASIMPAPSSNKTKLKALILFDWDDTLCPTSWMEEHPEVRQAFEGPVSKTGAAWNQLATQAKAVMKLVTTAASLGSVALVTLAARPWVRVSARDFLHEARNEVEKLDVYYAREQADSCTNFAHTFLCEPYIAMKRKAMQQAMAAVTQRVGHSVKWESLVSIGDSEVEKRAAQELGRECQSQGMLRWTKTVKLLEHPKVTQLTQQVNALNERLEELVNHPGHKNVNLADLLALT